MKHTIKYNVLIVSIILLTSASCNCIPSPRALKQTTKDFINNHLLAGNLKCVPYDLAVTEALEAKKAHKLTPALLAAAAFPPLQKSRTLDRSSINHIHKPVEDDII